MCAHTRTLVRVYLCELVFQKCSSRMLSSQTLIKCVDLTYDFSPEVTEITTGAPGVCLGREKRLRTEASSGRRRKVQICWLSLLVAG